MKIIDTYVHYLDNILFTSSTMWKLIKDIVLSVLINAAILYVLSSARFWIMITAKAQLFQVFFLLGGVFWLVNFGLKRLLHIVSFPLRFVTLGLFGMLINIVVLYFFQWLINTRFTEFAQVELSPEWIKILILSCVISFAYALLSKILK